PLLSETEERWVGTAALRRPVGAAPTLPTRALRFAQRSGYSDPVESSPMANVALKVAARLRENGHIAYFAGGCVRDMVRGLVPKDYDIVTDAPPEAVQSLFPHTFAVGAH